MDLISLIVFLGNTGKEYKNNRHNVAWLFADFLPILQNLSWQKKFKGEYSTIEREQEKVFLVKPHTFMNLSGNSIGEVAQFFKIEPKNILIIHDELELPLGTVSLKFSGGLGGHNGLRSARDNLKTADFWRLRFGIGRPTHNNIASWVLSDFLADERILLEHTFLQTEELFNELIKKNPHDLLPIWKKNKLC